MAKSESNKKKETFQDNSKYLFHSKVENTSGKNDVKKINELINKSSKQKEKASE